MVGNKYSINTGLRGEYGILAFHINQNQWGVESRRPTSTHCMPDVVVSEAQDLPGKDVQTPLMTIGSLVVLRNHGMV